MKKVWLQEYPAGVPEEVSLEEFASLNDLLEESINKFRDLTAFSCMGTSLSYSDIDRDSRAIAAFLSQFLGLERGSRVAIMMPNILQYPVILFGALRAGLTVVNVNPLYTAPELEFQLKDSGAETIFILENFAHVLERVLPKTAVKHVICTSLGAYLNKPKAWIVDFVVRKIKKMVPKYEIPAATSFNHALMEGRNLEFKNIEVNINDIAFLQYTGGTTGFSKGAILTHKNMIANVQQASAWLKNATTLGKEKIITALPLYHIFSLTANCLSYFKIGAENILVTNPRDIPNFVKILKDSKFSAITGVNTLFNALTQDKNFHEVDFSNLRISLGGGMAVQEVVAKNWQKITGSPIIQAYGLTETSPAVTINPLLMDHFNGSIGVPLPNTEVSIRNEKNEDLGFEKEGELCVKGPQVMQGYWNNKEETDAVFADGWLKTGDIAKMDEKGYLYIVDRKKDMILVSGFNVYPNEVEAVAISHPGVLEVAVVGMADEKSGEVVKMFVVRKDPSLQANNLIEFCREHLTSYKVPKSVEFRDELPKTNVGKILRRALKD